MRNRWRAGAIASSGSRTAGLWPTSLLSPWREHRQMPDIALAWTLARREMRSGLSGFRIFFLCLVLGVASIAGVESLSAAFLTGLAEHGRTLLGGDIAVGLVHRPATTAERA